MSTPAGAEPAALATTEAPHRLPVLDRPQPLGENLLVRGFVAFKAGRALRVGLAIAGSMAFQGPVVVWVADHRRHNTFADKDGDPHSPWLFGTNATALVKGFWHAHMGRLLGADQTNLDRFAPDLLSDPDMRRINGHNLHHADPTCARHGVGRGQLDMSARILAVFERLGWAHDVRWPTPRRLARLTGNR